MSTQHRDPRQAWAQAVRRARGLSMTAKVLAQALALDYANRETGLCNPSRQRLAHDLDVSEETIKRAVAKLRKAGWLTQSRETARNRTASYVFISPGNVVPFAVPNNANAGQERPTTDAATRVKSAPNAGQICTRPYKGRNQVKNHCAREGAGGDTCPVSTLHPVEPGSYRAEAWHSWLSLHGWPDLAALGGRCRLRNNDGWQMPCTMPPDSADTIALQVTERYLRWVLAGHEPASADQVRA